MSCARADLVVLVVLEQHGGRGRPIRGDAEDDDRRAGRGEDLQPDVRLAGSGEGGAAGGGLDAIDDLGAGNTGAAAAAASFVMMVYISGGVMFYTLAMPWSPRRSWSPP